MSKETEDLKKQIEAEQANPEAMAEAEKDIMSEWGQEREEPVEPVVENLAEGETPQQASEEPKEEEKLYAGKFHSIEEMEKGYLNEQSKITEQGQKISEQDQTIKEQEGLLDHLDKTFGEKMKEGKPEGKKKEIDPEIKKVQDELAEMKRKEEIKVATQQKYAEAKTKYPNIAKMKDEEFISIQKIMKENPIMGTYLAVEGLKVLTGVKETPSATKESVLEGSISRTKATVETPSGGGEGEKSEGLFDPRGKSSTEIKEYLEKQGVQYVQHD